MRSSNWVLRLIFAIAFLTTLFKQRNAEPIEILENETKTSSSTEFKDIRQYAKSMEHLYFGNTYTNTIRYKRGACMKISVEEINDWVVKINKITNYNPTETETFKEYPYKHSENCQEAKQNFENSVRNLSALYLSLKINHRLSERESQDLKLKYDAGLQSLETTINSIRQQASDEAKQKIDDMKREVDKVKQKMDETYVKLIELQKKHKDNLFALCVLEISSGNDSNAMNKFTELKAISNDEEIRKVVDNVYHVNRIEKIINFVEKSSNINDKARAYDRLSKKIKDNGDIRSHHVLSVDFFTTKALRNAQESPTAKNILENTQSNLQSMVRASIEAMAQQIRNSNNIQSIIDFSHERWEVVYSFISRINEVAYLGTEESALKIVEFMYDIWEINTLARAYIDFYALMQKSGHHFFEPTLRMAVEVKRISGSDHFKGLLVRQGVENLINFKNLKDKFHHVIRVIVWESVCIKNVGADAYLYDHGVYDSDRRNVTVSKQREGNYQWIFEGVERMKFLRIKNRAFNEYFYAANDHFKMDNNRRRVFTFRSRDPVSQGEWKLIDIDWRDAKFYIFNTHHNEYLNVEMIKTLTADSLLNLLRLNLKYEPGWKAFTWKGEGKGPQPIWTIIPC